MLSKKLIALFVTVATVSVVSAGWYDEDGNYHHGLRPHHVVEDTTVGAGHAAERTVTGASDVAIGTVAPIFGGRNVKERMEDREARREQRRADREARREARRTNRE